MNTTHRDGSMLNERFAEVSNARVRVVFDLAAGTYDLHDPTSGLLSIRGAYAQIEQWSSRDAEYSRQARHERFSSELGSGQRLTITCSASGRPTLFQEFSVFDSNEAVVILRTGMTNTSDVELRVRRFFPLRDGYIESEEGLIEAQTLSANSSCHEPEVVRTPYASSTNNLLLTFKDSDKRRSIVLGALKTADFMKWAHTLPKGGWEPRATALNAALPGARIVAYLDCRVRSESLFIEGPRLSVLSGTREAHRALVHPREIMIGLDNLKRTKRYAIGYSWRDHNGTGKSGCVKVFAADRVSHVLRETNPLPTGDHGKEFAALLPADIAKWRRPWVAFINEAQGSDITVDEVWLWEVDSQTDIHLEWTQGRLVSEVTATTNDGAWACLEAGDPVGRRISPGTTYLPDDSFYIDIGTHDPFEALEKYGKELRRATHANPNPYDFPSVCAWYAGVWHTKGAQNHPEKSTYQINTTAGLVREVAEIGNCGFLKYSRVCGRLVPDTYNEINPQGWWDDEHWRQHGYYVAPYETSAAFGKAMHDQGCLAFTYIQPMCGWARQPVSRDFRQQHSHWLCGQNIERSLDYTHPEVQQYLRRVFGSMQGSIDGLMVDYCDDHWDPEAVLGEFDDPDATSTSFYRVLFQLIKEGLGSRSWLHERNLHVPNNDLTLGFVDLQRLESDTDQISPALVSRGGLRWYKNRVVIGYDMDSKDLNTSWKIMGWNGSDRDGRRMTLTMAYVAASRLLIANSFRDLDKDALHDLSRTFPYPTEARSARPIDAFAHDGFPRVYDFAVTPQWHQVTLHNNTLPTKEETFSIAMSGNQVDGALGLDAAADYYVFDFWNQRFVGRIKGRDRLEQTLRPGEARMLSIHQVEANPQFISTDRHLMQGYLDFEKCPTWDPITYQLSGVSKVIGGEPYRIVVALNGYQAMPVADGYELSSVSEDGLVTLSILREQNESVHWSIHFAKGIK